MDSLKGYLDIIAESLDKKLKVLKQVEAMNERQRSILMAEDFDMDAFEATVDEKSKLAEELERLDDGFSAVYDRVRAELPNMKDSYKSEITLIKKLVKEITDSSVAIQGEETRINAMFKNAVQREKSGVKETRRSSSMANNYYKVMKKVDAATPQFFDQNS